MRKLMMSIVMMAAILGMQSNVHAKSQIFNKSTKKIDVIVVGAGVSGLTMAYHLKKIGKSFQILEQSSHIGGRVRTAAYPNGKAEVGLEEFWDNNPFLKVMRELNVPLETTYASFSSFCFQEKCYPFTQDTNLQFLQSILSPEELAAFKTWDEHMMTLHRQLSMRPLPDELMALKDQSFGDWVQKTSGLSPMAQEIVRIETEPEFATSWSKISALDGIAEWFIFSGEGVVPWHVKAGNQSGVMAVANFIGKKAIELNKQVTHIKSTQHGVEVTALDTATYKQQTYKAKYVVTTVPLFKLSDIQFEPSLPDEQQQAIDSQAGGAYFTAHVIVDDKAKRFWSVDGQSILPILSDGPLGVIYEGDAKKGHDAIINLLLTGQYAQQFNSRLSNTRVMRQAITEAFEKQWPGFSVFIKQMIFYRYHPYAIASWPVGRSRFDLLSDSLRRPYGRIYFAGDFTEDTHSNGAANSALRVIHQLNQAN